MAIIRHTLAPDGDHTRAAVRRDVRARAVRVRARGWHLQPVVQTISNLSSVRSQHYGQQQNVDRFSYTFGFLALLFLNSIILPLGD